MSRFFHWRARGCFTMLGVLAVLPLARGVPADGSGKGPVAAEPYPIVISADAPPAVVLAADELERYLEAMGPVQVEVRRGVDPPKRSIVLESRPPGAAVGEGYVVSQVGERIVIRGERPRAVLFAVYDVLDRLGCRWLAPGFGFYGAGESELVPKNARLELALDAPIKEQPVLAHRKLYVEEGHSHDAESLRKIIEWMPKLRYNTLVVPTDYQGRGRVKWDNWREALTPELRKRDLVIEVGGHGYQNFLNAEMEEGKWFREHPEWFGQDAQGKRTKVQARVFCTSNAAARRFVTERFLAYVRDRPEIQIFDFWPPDGARWCECGECLALGSPSERQALLLNEVREAAKKVRPDLRLEVLAYSTSITPPEKTRLKPDVLVDFCPIAQSFDRQIFEATEGANATYTAGLSAWRKAFEGEISIYSYYRKYAWRSLPVVIPGYIQKDLQWYRKMPTQGVSIYAEPGDWAAYELNHYGLGRLAWNPDADLDRVVEQFCHARFGTQAAPARKALLAMGELLRTTGNIPGTRLKSVEEIAAGQRLLQQALIGLEQAPVNPAVTRLKLCGEYARRDLEIQELRARKSPLEEIRPRIESLSTFLNGQKDAGVFLVHSRLEVPRLLQSYGLVPRRPAAD